MATNLILHCGASRVEREQLTTVATPAATETWCPIPHLALVEQVEKALTTVNMRVVNQSHALTKEGNRYFGLLEVANCQSDKDYAYVLGLRNSHDKSLPASLVIGSQVFVCDNLSFSGEIRMDRKHTTHIMADLAGLTCRAVGRLSDKWNDMGRRIEAYKTHELSDSTAHDLVVRMLDAKAITTTQIPGVLNEWRTPRHPEFAQYRNVWRLFNAVTEMSKGGNLFTLSNRTQSLHALCDRQVGLLTQTEFVKGSATDVEVVVTA